jgi:hypothetical protein
MKFGEIPLDEALGAILAHGVSLDGRLRNPGGGQPFDPFGMRLAAAQRADIERVPGQRDDQGRVVQLGVVGQGDDGGPLVDIQR